MRSKLTRVLLAAAMAATVAPLAAQPSYAAAAPSFRNCTALNAHYPHGVGRPGARDRVRGNTRPVTNFKVGRALYNANKRLDRDHDGVACEKR